jgi:Domain of Unknown Function (DUF928)
MQQFFRSALGISFVFAMLLTSIGNQLPVVMQSAYAQSTRNGKNAKFRLPTPNRTPPITGRRKGAGTLGVCGATPLPLTALVPEYSNGQVFAQTVSSNPTLLFYVPYTSADNHRLTFVLQDEDGKEVYKQFVSSPQSPGLISVTIPSKLDINKQYQWFFKINCENPPQTVFGVIQRVALSQNVMQQINDATPEQKVRIYAENGIWYDALSILANLRRSRPQDTALKDDWNGLLNDVDLTEMNPQPILK